jgi:DNA-cytosine methyltransferase
MDDTINLHSLTKQELLAKCNELGVKKCKTKKKSELIEIIQQHNMSNIPKEKKSHVVSNGINAIDLFCGCGGWSQGLTDAGFNIIAGIDIWDKAIDNYRKNFNHHAICRDLTTFPPEEFDRVYNTERKEIDVIFGSPPCQGFSLAGKRDSTDSRNLLFMEFVKYVNYFNPKAFVMENVIGLLSMKTETGENVIDNILSQFKTNYNCIVL